MPESLEGELGSHATIRNQRNHLPSRILISPLGPFPEAMLNPFLFIPAEMSVLSSGSSAERGILLVATALVVNVSLDAQLRVMMLFSGCLASGSRMEAR